LLTGNDSAFAATKSGMSIALRKSPQNQRTVPQRSFGPFLLLHALPWLILATAMRVLAFTGVRGHAVLLEIIVANLAVLQAFLVTARHAIEAAGGNSQLGELGPAEQYRLSRAILWRLVLVMIATAIVLALAGFGGIAFHAIGGIDGIVFDLVSTFSKFWSASIAALVLLILVRAGQHGGKVALFAALGEFARRWFWLGGAVIVLGIAYLGLGLVQGVVRAEIWNFWQLSSASQFIKNLVYFVFIFGFAMLRLWMTLLILTFGLKQSYLSGD
jgi:hypothetical protein